MKNLDSKNVAICVGAKKAGTSWLYKCLEEHPEINPAWCKETNFFLEDTACEKFIDFFHSPKEGNLYFEASPNYFTCELARKNIQACIPRAKIIIILRHPLNRTQSHINHLLNTKRIPKGYDIAKLCFDKYEVIDHSNYTKHVSEWINVFGSNQVLLLDYARIASAPQSVIDEVCDFLSISRFTPRFLETKYNTSKARSNRLYNLITRIYLRSRKIPITKQIVLRLRALGFDSGLVERILSIGTPSQTISTQDLEYLSETLADEIRYYQNFQADKQ